MPRKKNAAQEAAHIEASATAAAVAEPETKAATTPAMKRPAYIDGPPVNEEGKVIGPANPDAKNWGDPYKALFTGPNFEMGENRRFKQRVFMFKEKPSDEVRTALKENGFTYRAGENAWTIQANPDTRRLSDELTREFAGQTQGISR